MSWLRPSNRSARVRRPSGPSKTYLVSTFTQGSARRSRLISSRWRVSCFSLINNSLRAASHSARGTAFGRSIRFVFMTDCLPLGMLRFCSRGDPGDTSDQECTDGSGRGYTRTDQDCGFDTCGAHHLLLRDAELLIRKIVVREKPKWTSGLAP